MLDLTAWVNKAAPHCDYPVEQEANLDDAQNTRSFPSVSLVPGRDQVQHAGMHPNVKHEVTSEVMLVTAISRGSRDGDDSDELNGIRLTVLSQFINWQPPGADNVVLWQGGQLLKLNNQSIFWVDVLSIEHTFKKVEETL
ncbi:MAG: hypothetical protein CMH98_04915 [Oceanospirillaceae bacterium]|nr:hypothetical protein [Oceanospirillaceae bacterium]